MQCPVDGETLMMTERKGVEIDYCPKCRGVWLDRGELDKMIEQAPSEATFRGGREFESRRPQHRKKKSMLSELFDF